MKYTQLRHEMLDLIARGAVSNENHHWTIRRGLQPSTAPQVSRACNSLYDGGYLKADRGDVKLTPAGEYLLSMWNSGNRS